MAVTDSKSRTIRFSRIVDLSHPLDVDIPLWPGDPAVDFRTVADYDSDGFRLRSLQMGEHSGTHMNAPISFHRFGASIDSYGVDSLVLPVVVIDIRQQSSANADYCLDREDVYRWECLYGQVPAGSLVLMASGWDRRWQSPGSFLNLDGSGMPHYPGFALDAARFLIEQRHVAGLGGDTHGVDPGCDQNFEVNRWVLQQPRIVLENLTRLDQLPAVGATVVVGVLKLRGGSGSPATVLAFVP